MSRWYLEVTRLDKATWIVAYLDAILRANAGTFEEVIEMSDATITLEEVFEKVGWMAKWEERRALKVEENMIKKEYPFEDIVLSTELDPEKVKKLYEKQ